MTRGLRFAGWIAASTGDPVAGLRFMVAAEAEQGGWVSSTHPPTPPEGARDCRGGRNPQPGRAGGNQASCDHAPLASVVDEAVAYLRHLFRGTA